MHRTTLDFGPCDLLLLGFSFFMAVRVSSWGDDGRKAFFIAIMISAAVLQVINRVLPEHVPKHADALRQLRERYEGCLSDLIAELPVPASIDRSLLRLMILPSWSVKLRRLGRLVSGSK